MTKFPRYTDEILITKEKNRRLLDLALDCRFIAPSQKDGIILKLEDRSQTARGPGLAEVLRETQLISEEKIAYLYALDAHLATRLWDRQFGRIAVANGMVAQKYVDQALAFQVRIFEKSGKCLKIGDILVEKGHISIRQQLSILLTQNRIKNENLLAALDALSGTDDEKENFGRLFGAIAVRRGRVTRTQAVAALKQQKEETAQGLSSRFIGDIFKETVGVSEADIQDILLEQKQIEKRRMDLEHALYSARDELKIVRRLNRLFECRISNDGTQALVEKQKEPDKAIGVYEFLIWLKRTGIRFGIVDDTAIEKFIFNAKAGSQLLAARGYPPVPRVDEGWELLVKEGDRVQKGGLIARVIPGKKGKPGRSVLGYELVPALPCVCPLSPGIQVEKANGQFFALMDGVVVIKKGTLLMVESEKKAPALRRVNQDINGNTQDTYALADVKMAGTIGAKGVLKCRSLVLNGAIRGRVTCAGDMEVAGNIGIDESVENDQASDIRPRITCHGSVRASRSVFNAQMRVTGFFNGGNARIVGSRIIAKEGLLVHDAYCGRHGPCFFRFGLAPKDPLVDLDYTLEVKTRELSVLRQKENIRALKQQYDEDVATETARQGEQVILSGLMEIMTAPELHPADDLEGKLKYLERLPDHSSVKASYLIRPKTDAGTSFLRRLKEKAKRMTPDEFRQLLGIRMGGEPKGGQPDAGLRLLETRYNQGLSDLNRTVEKNAVEIGALQNEIQQLLTARQALARSHLKSLSSKAVVRIKGKCEKHTVILGKTARYVVPRTLYQVRFEEGVNKQTGRAAIFVLS